MNNLLLFLFTSVLSATFYLDSGQGRCDSDCQLPTRPCKSIQPILDQNYFPNYDVRIVSDSFSCDSLPTVIGKSFVLSSSDVSKLILQAQSSLTAYFYISSTTEQLTAEFTNLDFRLYQSEDYVTVPFLYLGEDCSATLTLVSIQPTETISVSSCQNNCLANLFWSSSTGTSSQSSSYSSSATSTSALSVPLINATLGTLTLEGVTIKNFDLVDSPLLNVSTIPNRFITKSYTGSFPYEAVPNVFQRITRSSGNGTVLELTLDSTSQLNLDSCTFINCTALDGAGGAVYLNISTKPQSLSFSSVYFAGGSCSSPTGARELHVVIPGKPEDNKDIWLQIVSDNNITLFSTTDDVIYEGMKLYYFLLEDSSHQLTNMFELLNYTFVSPSGTDTSSCGLLSSPCRLLLSAAATSCTHIIMYADRTVQSPTAVRFDQHDVTIQPIMRSTTELKQAVIELSSVGEQECATSSSTTSSSSTSSSSAAAASGSSYTSLLSSLWARTSTHLSHSAFDNDASSVPSFEEYTDVCFPALITVTGKCSLLSILYVKFVLYESSSSTQPMNPLFLVETNLILSAVTVHSSLARLAQPVTLGPWTSVLNAQSGVLTLNYTTFSNFILTNEPLLNVNPASAQFNVIGASFENITRLYGNGSVLEATITNTLSPSYLSFTECHCTHGVGGALYLSLSSGTFQLTGSAYFYSCSSSYSSLSAGGAIYLTVTGSSSVSIGSTSYYSYPSVIFTNCVAKNGYGGAIYVDVTGTPSIPISFNTIGFSASNSRTLNGTYIYMNVNDSTWSEYWGGFSRLKSRYQYDNTDGWFVLGYPTQKTINFFDISSSMQAAAGVYYVNGSSGSSYSGCGHSTTDACDSLSSALLSISAADATSSSILIAPGSYLLEDVVTVTRSVDMTHIDSDSFALDEFPDDPVCFLIDTILPLAGETIKPIITVTNASSLYVSYTSFVIDTVALQNPVFYVDSDSFLWIFRVDVHSNATSTTAILLNVSFVQAPGCFYAQYSSFNNLTLSNVPLVTLSSLDDNFMLEDCSFTDITRNSGNGSVIGQTITEGGCLEIGTSTFTNCLCKNGNGGAIALSTANGTVVFSGEPVFENCHASVSSKTEQTVGRSIMVMLTSENASVQFGSDGMTYKGEFIYDSSSSSSSSSSTSESEEAVHYNPVFIDVYSPAILGHVTINHESVTTDDPFIYVQTNDVFTIHEDTHPIIIVALSGTNTITQTVDSLTQNACFTGTGMFSTSLESSVETTVTIAQSASVSFQHLTFCLDPVSTDYFSDADVGTLSVPQIQFVVAKGSVTFSYVCLCSSLCQPFSTYVLSTQATTACSVQLHSCIVSSIHLATTPLFHFTQQTALLCYNTSFRNIFRLSGSGSVLDHTATAAINFTSTEFLGCKSNGDGGALYLTMDSGSLVLHTLSFVGCSAGTDYATTLSGTALQNSGTGSSSGGAVYLRINAAIFLSVHAMSYSANTATGNGNQVFVVFASSALAATYTMQLTQLVDDDAETGDCEYALVDADGNVSDPIDILILIKVAEKTKMKLWIIIIIIVAAVVVVIIIIIIIIICCCCRKSQKGKKKDSSSSAAATPAEKRQRRMVREMALYTTQ